MANARVTSVSGSICAAVCLLISACGGERSATPMVMAGQGGAPVISGADNPSTAGKPAAGSGGSPLTGDAGAIAAGSGGAGSGGAVAAGSGGAVAAGSGGASGAAGAAGSSAAGSGGQGGAAGADVEQDPFGGIFGPAADACEGLLCVEAADCADLYPDETASCKFTQCVDFQCK